MNDHILPTSTGLMLRFRDLVTEPGGNIKEHSMLINEFGFAWWGWWARNQEKLPRRELEKIFENEPLEVPILLFDSGQMNFYTSVCSKVVVAPGDEPLGSPDFRTTPHYYVRGRYPAWFRLHTEISKVETPSHIKVHSRPTFETQLSVPNDFSGPDFRSLRDERATLWLVEWT